MGKRINKRIEEIALGWEGWVECGAGQELPTIDGMGLCRTMYSDWEIHFPEHIESFISHLYSNKGLSRVGVC